MNNYKVTIETSVYVDDYKQGELDYVNWYLNTKEIEEETPIKAIEKAMNYYGFSFNPKYSQTNEEENLLWYSNLVDNDNFEITEKDSLYKEWKKGKVTLYSANHNIKVHQLNETKLTLN